MGTPKATEHTVEGFTVWSRELDFMTAADLVPELASVLGAGAEIATTGGDDVSVAKALGAMARALSGGKLSALLPRLLGGLEVVVPDDDGKPIRIELTGPNARNRAFANGRKKLATGCIKLALEANFRDFFDAADLTALGIRPASH